MTHPTRDRLALIVEDEPTERRGLARLVAQVGYRVATAGTGEEALRAAERHPPPA